MMRIKRQNAQMKLLSDINDDKNEEIDEEKDAECLDDTSRDEIKEGVSD